MAFANVRRVMMKHKRGAKCPLLEKFLSECVEEDVGQFVATSDIYEAYGSAVSVWTDGDRVNGQTKFLIKKSGFNKQLKKNILQHGQKHEWSVRPDVKNGQRGYSGIRLKRPRRCPPGYEFGGRLMMQSIANYIANPPPVPPIEIHSIPSDPRGAGVCAFASRDICRGEVVVEYKGKVVEEKEAAQRQMRYQSEGKPCTLMIIENRGHQIAIDPFRGGQCEEWGATSNHSLNFPNLKLAFVTGRNSENPRVFLVALHDIPETVEFLWNYNDTDWECHANSQTLPNSGN